VLVRDCREWRLDLPRELAARPLDDRLHEFGRAKRDALRNRRPVRQREKRVRAAAVPSEPRNCPRRPYV
jgi:hypothetical protein